MRYLALLLLALVTTAAQCNAGSTVYQHDSTVSMRLLDVSSTPAKAVGEERQLYQIGSGWSSTSPVVVSPTGQFAAIGIYRAVTSGSGRNNEGSLIVFDVPQRTVVREYEKSDLIEITDFPLADASMFIMNLRWLDNDQLVVDMQPQTPWRATAPQNIALTIDVKTQVSTLQHYDRVAASPVTTPEHASHTKYDHELLNGVLHVNGSGVGELRTGIQKYGVWFP